MVELGTSSQLQKFSKFPRTYELIVLKLIITAGPDFLHVIDLLITSCARGSARVILGLKSRFLTKIPGEPLTGIRIPTNEIHILVCNVNTLHGCLSL